MCMHFGGQKRHVSYLKLKFDRLLIMRLGIDFQEYINVAFYASPFMYF